MPEKTSQSQNREGSDSIRERTLRGSDCPQTDTASGQSDTRAISVLLVEDDIQVAAALAASLRSAGMAPTVCHSIALAEVAARTEVFAVVVLDDQLPDGNGSLLMERLHGVGITCPMIMTTAFPDVARAVHLMRGGLFDYLPKPFRPDALAACIARALRHSFAAQHRTISGYAGSSAAVRKVRELVAQAAANPIVTVLVTGETGTGKELTAKLIHETTFGDDNKPPLVSLDCSAVPAELFESELFGAERGAYTGANQARMGLVEAAQRGTLFLDEIGEMPLPLQAKLLRFLETREFRRLGSTTIQKFSGRVIAATNRDLAAHVKTGHFRSDLLYRLDVFTIPLPPLRELHEDIATIAEELLVGIAVRHGRTAPFFRSEDLAALSRYSFPGNVRELRNLVERALVRTPLSAHWLHFELPDAAPAAPPAAHKVTTLAETEYETLRRALVEENWNISRTAKRLGTSRQSILRRIEKWPDLHRPAEMTHGE